MYIDKERPPKCRTDYDLFYSDQDDGRSEPGREDREALAGAHCMGCPYQLKCLEESLVNDEQYGVWGGMGEGMRRKFRTHLIEEGYGKKEVPTGDELEASLRAFYFYMDTPIEQFHAGWLSQESVSA